MKGLVSVVIVSWNRLEVLIQCLESLLKQDYPWMEIIVVDNGSSDSTPETIERRFPMVRLVRNRANVGAAAGRNQGIKLSRGQYVWFLDSDVIILDSNCLSRMVEVFELTPGIGALGGEAVVDEEGAVAGVKKVDMRPNGMPRGQVIAGGRPYEVHYCDWLITANFFTRRAYLESIGGFDPWYFFLGEDQDVGIRLSRLGLNNAVLARMPVLHKYATVAGMSKLFRANRNRVYFAFKCLSLAHIVLLPVLDAAYFLDLSNVGRARRFLMRASSGRKPSPWRLIVLGATDALSVLWGYLAVLPWIPRAVKQRLKPQDYLRETEVPNE